MPRSTSNDTKACLALLAPLGAVSFYWLSSGSLKGISQWPGVLVSLIASMLCIASILREGGR